MTSIFWRFNFHFASTPSCSIVQNSLFLVNPSVSLNISPFKYYIHFRLFNSSYPFPIISHHFRLKSCGIIAHSAHSSFSQHFCLFWDHFAAPRWRPRACCPETSSVLWTASRWSRCRRSSWRWSSGRGRILELSLGAGDGWNLDWRTPETVGKNHLEWMGMEICFPSMF